LVRYSWERLIEQNLDFARTWREMNDVHRVG
jgi:hypothetical protein